MSHYDARMKINTVVAVCDGRRDGLVVAPVTSILSNQHVGSKLEMYVYVPVICSRQSKFFLVCPEIVLTLVVFINIVVVSVMLVDNPRPNQSQTVVR